MKYLYILFSILLLSITSNLLAQGAIIERSFEEPNANRQYSLYVPESYDGSTAYPLVISYHGFGGTPAQQMAVTGMNAVADTAGFLVAYPLALEVTNPLSGARGRGWNVVEFIDSTYSDTDFTANMIAHIAEDYTIDANRIHATGWSFGSEMALSLACELPNTIASVAGVAEQLAEFIKEDCKPGRPYALLTMHGTNDALIPFNGGFGFWTSADRTPSHFAGLNRCDDGAIVTELPNINPTDNSTVTLYEYSNCEEEVEVRFYQINGGGHSWPGGDGVGTVNQDINASVEIWNFFTRNPLPTILNNTTHQSSNMPAIQLSSNLVSTTLNLNSSTTAEVTYVLLDFQGQVLRGGRFQTAVQLDLSRLKNGIYMLSCKVGNTIVNEKIVKVD